MLCASLPCLFYNYGLYVIKFLEQEQEQEQEQQEDQEEEKKKERQRKRDPVMGNFSLEKKMQA